MIGESLAITAGGFLGSAHCIGMCGGFACASGFFLKAALHTDADQPGAPVAKPNTE